MQYKHVNRPPPSSLGPNRKEMFALSCLLKAWRRGTHLIIHPSLPLCHVFTLLFPQPYHLSPLPSPAFLLLFPSYLFILNLLHHHCHSFHPLHLLTLLADLLLPLLTHFYCCCCCTPSHCRSSTAVSHPWESYMHTRYYSHSYLFGCWGGWRGLSNLWSSDLQTSWPIFPHQKPSQAITYYKSACAVVY